MAKQVITNAKLYVGGYDLSGSMNALALSVTADAVDQTTFGQASRVRAGGLKSVAASHAGLWEPGVGLVDETLFNGMGPQVATLSANGASESDVAFFSTMVETEYALGGAVGENLAFTVGMQGNGGGFRGIVLHNAARSASGTGTIIQVGQVTAAQTATAVLHVYGATGTLPTLDVKIQSAAAIGFASPTDRITFGQKTTVGAEQSASVAGPITDTYWRVVYTIGGGAPNFTFLVVLSIQ